MFRLRRRSFFGCAAVPFAAALRKAAAQPQPSGRVFFTGDGLNTSAADYARTLTAITEGAQFRRDTYLHGGPVEELEKRMAAELGKERAVFLATGTLANHLAVRVLAGDKRKVLLQHESHLYRDEGDAAQLLSGLNLVPLAPGRTNLTLDEISKAVAAASGPPYPTPVGAISIESPVRRTYGEVFDFEEMKKVCAFARKNSIGTHLDGARLYLASAYTGIAPSTYAAEFDTVYVSLYKYFNAPFGAILAGSASLISQVERLRHQFGNLIYQGWESAAIALHYVEGFTGRYADAVKNGETVLRLLEQSSRFAIDRIPSGSNISFLRLKSEQPLDQFAERLNQAGITINAPKGATRALLQINETINRRPPADIAAAFLKAAG